MPENLYERDGVWYARFSVNGKIRRKSLQTSDLRRAKARLKKLLERAADHKFGVEAPKTWNEAVQAYVTGVLNQNGVKPGTAKRYLVSLRQIDPHLSGTALANIDLARIGRFVQDRQAVATNATVNRDLTVISRVLSYAKAHGMCQSNAAEDYDRSFTKEKRAPISAPSDDAVAQGRAALTNGGESALADLVAFLRATGMRLGEALRARREDLHGKELTILETKSRSRTIDLAPDPLRTVLEVKKGRIFPALPIDSGAVSSNFQHARRKLPGLPRFRLHDLRHAYAISELRGGRDIYDLSHHLGHSSVKVTEMYLGYVSGGRASSRNRRSTQSDTAARTSDTETVDEN
jgi:integrase